MKRKFEEDPWSSPVRPTKRLSMFDNTPKQWKEQRRRILKLSKKKLKAIEDVDCQLRKSVLINNTYRKMKRELQENNTSPTSSWQYTPKPLFSTSRSARIQLSQLDSDWDMEICDNNTAIDAQYDDINSRELTPPTDLSKVLSDILGEDEMHSPPSSSSEDDEDMDTILSSARQCQNESIVDNNVNNNEVKRNGDITAVVGCDGKLDICITSIISANKDNAESFHDESEVGVKRCDTVCDNNISCDVCNRGNDSMIHVVAQHQHLDCAELDTPINYSLQKTTMSEEGAKRGKIGKDSSICDNNDSRSNYSTNPALYNANTSSNSITSSQSTNKLTTTNTIDTSNGVMETTTNNSVNKKSNEMTVCTSYDLSRKTNALLSSSLNTNTSAINNNCTNAMEDFVICGKMDWSQKYIGDRVNNLVYNSITGSMLPVIDLRTNFMCPSLSIIESGTSSLSPSPSKDNSAVLSCDSNKHNCNSSQSLRNDHGYNNKDNKEGNAFKVATAIAGNTCHAKTSEIEAIQCDSDDRDQCIDYSMKENMAPDGLNIKASLPLDDSLDLSSPATSLCGCNQKWDCNNKDRRNMSSSATIDASITNNNINKDKDNGALGIMMESDINFSLNATVNSNTTTSNCDNDINQHIWACFQQFNMAIACS